jgi:hypothetical protein
MMIDPVWARQFAEDWIDAWNSHDLERIFSQYTDDFEITSPLVIKRMKEPSGTLKGKDAVRPYWHGGLQVKPPLRFELKDVLAGVNSITLYYRRVYGDFAAEVLIFNEQKQVVKTIVHYS